MRARCRAHPPGPHLTPRCSALGVSRLRSPLNSISLDRTVRRKPVLALELFLNGKRAALASSTGMSVVSAILSWVETVRVTHEDGSSHPRPAHVEINLGGLSRGRTGEREHIHWLNAGLKPGDVVTIRVTDTTRTQLPASKRAELPRGRAPVTRATGTGARFRSRRGAA
jgi:hypothetical protein